MNIFTREFSFREKVLLLVLALVIISALYYLFIFQPVTDRTKRAESSASDLETQLVALDTKVAQIHRMQKSI